MSFRREKLAEVETLLVHWRAIERGLKVADHFHAKALVPAINELRYAGRQLFYALRLIWDSASPNPGVRSSISKRIIIAEQYLQNAEHDIVDSIVAVLIKETRSLNESFGAAIVTVYYAGFPKLCEDLSVAKKSMQDSRDDIVARKEVYRNIREKQLPTFISAREQLTAAAVEAGLQLKQRQLELEHAKAQLEDSRIREAKGQRFNLFAGIVTIISLAWSLLATDYKLVLPRVEGAFGALSAPHKESSE